MKQPLEQTLSGLQLGYDLGGYVTIPTDNAWHVLTLPLSAFAMTGAASPYTYLKLSFRIHGEGYADARYEQSSSGNQGYTYILACRPA